MHAASTLDSSDTSHCRAVPVLKVMYLFAGKRRHSDIGSFLRKAEEQGLIRLELRELDIERSSEHDLTDDALWDSLFALLREGNWILIVSPPCNSFSRARFQYRLHPGPRPLRSKTWPRGFPWLSNSNSLIVQEANRFVDRCIEACQICRASAIHFLFEHPEDLGVVHGEHPGSVWQWPEIRELIASTTAQCFAIHQCHFGADTPKPTRFLTTMHTQDPRCLQTLPRFDKLGFYKGPLPRDCGHVHARKLIGKSKGTWNTGPSASYPPLLCEFLAGLVLSAHAASGGGTKSRPATTTRVFPKVVVRDPPQPESQPPSKVPKLLKQVEVLDLTGEDDSSLTPLNQVSQEDGDEFDLESCLNRGRPMSVEWGGKCREFVDGFGLCSLGRWPPKARGERRSEEMKRLAAATFDLLSDTVRQVIQDPRKEAFRLVTGKLTQSPFPAEVLTPLRSKWAELLSDPGDALVVDQGQPFLLRGLAQWLGVFEDPDAKWLVDVEDSLASGVCLGVEKPLPRSPQVCPPKVKRRKLDESEFSPIAQNYASADMSSPELEAKFREEEALGRMFPSKLGVLREQYGDKLRVASMAAIKKPDGSVRPLHDGTHSVRVNNVIRYQDQLECPGPGEIAAVVRTSVESREAPFCVSADIKAAHRLVKIRKADWGYMCCRVDSSSETVWVNQVGTFGISSAPFWWSKLCGLIGRFVMYCTQDNWLLHMIYVDDLHGAFIGQHKFWLIWVWLLAFELVGVPFGYHKFHGGFASEFVGFNLRYDLAEVGISEKRGRWLLEWITKATADRFVVVGRSFIEFLGRLGFVSQLLTWLKPHLSPLFAWAAVVAPGTVGKLPDTVILTLKYIDLEFKGETFLVSVNRPIITSHEIFRTDAKCTEDFVVLGGWELSTRRWFSLRLTPHEVPFLFQEGKGAMWASTSAELLASLVALGAFGWITQGKHRKSVPLVLAAGTDNRANDALSTKRTTTKWPLMGINMQLSSAIAKARLSLDLRWRPREENEEADSLTNEVFDAFDLELRVPVTFSDLDLSMVFALWETKREFDELKERARLARASTPKHKVNKKVDKSPW